jgi:alpha-tubulin suppressor-like RCC1 family protein
LRSRQYHNYANSQIALDNAGNVYVTGYSRGAGSSDDYTTLKYDTKGNQLWATRYNGTGNGDDHANAIALDSAGNVYVTGYSRGSGTGDDYATLKYDANGKQRWAGRYSGTGGRVDQAVAIAVDSAGKVYVTGTSAKGSVMEDYVTVKYDTYGAELWAEQYHLVVFSIYNRLSAITVDDAGNVYITGSCGGDYVTIKYSKNGTKLWDKFYNGIANGYDSATAIAGDKAGNVYVTGYSLGYGDFDCVTIKYNSAGSQLWANRYFGAPNASFGSAIAVDGSGKVYVVGTANSGSVSHPWSSFLTMKYNTGGTPLWAAVGTPYDGANGGSAIALDAAGNVYVTGSATLAGKRHD